MPIFLTSTQIHQFLDIARRSSPRDYAILRLMANTGLRESDVLAIERATILTSSGKVTLTLVLKMKKTGKTIEKTLTEPTREALTEYLKIAPKSEWLFPGEIPSHPLSRRSLDRIFKRHLKTLLGEEISLKGSSTHSLRRSVASLVQTESGIEAAACWLGHTNCAATMHYLNKALLREKAERLIEGINL